MESPVQSLRTQMSYSHAGQASRDPCQVVRGELKSFFTAWKDSPSGVSYSHAGQASRDPCQVVRGELKSLFTAWKDSPSGVRLQRRPLIRLARALGIMGKPRSSDFEVAFRGLFHSHPNQPRFFSTNSQLTTFQKALM